MSFEAGSIYYTIEAKTGALLTADKQVSSFNQRAQEGFERTAASMSKLTTIAKDVSAALVSSQVIAYAQSWNELEDRIQNTGATASQTKDILDQLLATSDRNGRTIEESSELYIRLSNSMKELGYSTQGTLSYIDTLSNLMTINKTNAIGAESAINALTKAQMKGKLAGVEAMAVFNAMPSILKTLGKQLNKTEAGVRKMASDGKLSMSDFTDAMIAAQEETAALADNMRNTVTDGINRVTNNLKKYLGELNNSTGATKVLVDSLILMSQHVDILMTGVGALAAIYAGKYITSLASATKQSVEQTIASIRQAQAEKAAAQAALQQAQAEIVHLRAVQQSLSAQLKLAQTETTRNAIRKQLKANTDALTAATNQQTAAQARLDVAMKATSFAAKGLRSAMALLGGPAGILILAAGALMTWSSKANEAKQKAMDLTPNIDALTESFKQMNKEQREAEKIRLSREIQEQITQIKKQEKAIKDLKKSTSNQNVKYGFSLNGDAKKVNEDIITLNGGLADMKVKLENLQQQMQQYQVVEDKAAKSGENLSKNWDDASKSEIDKKLASISKELDIATLKSQGNSEAAFVLDGLYSALGKRADEYKDDLMALALGQANFTKLTNDQVAALQPLVAQLKALSVENNKIKSSNKKGTTKSYAEEVKELSDKLAVAKLEAQGLTVEAELLAITQKMGGKVTAEQTEKLRKLIETSQAYKALGTLQSPIDIEKNNYNNSKTALDDWFSKNPQKYAEYNTKLEELEKQHQINMAKIKSDSVVSKIDDAIAQVDPVQALKNEHDRKLALIQEFENQKWLTEENAIALREAANHQYEQNRINAQWEIWRNQSDANEFLASSLEGLASSATSTISGLASGTMTATQAMQNFANVILNEAIGSLVQMGMQYVKNAIVAKTTSASTTAAQILEAQALAAAYQPAAMYASIATQGAAATTGATSYATAIGSMKALGIAYGGGRLRGGGVDVGKAYRVNESGEPELFVAHGKQYMIPNKNGEVIPSNKLSRGAAGRTIINNITQNISFGEGQGNKEAANETARMLKQALRSVIQEEQRPGGLLNRR